MKREDIPVTPNMVFFWNEEQWKRLIVRVYSHKGAERVKKFRLARSEAEKPCYTKDQTEEQS